MKRFRLPLLLLGCFGALSAHAQTVHNISNVTYTSAMGPQNIGYFPGTGLVDEIHAGANVTVQSGANVTYAPGSAVRLAPGFHAAAGSYFNAFIFTGSPPGGGSNAPTWTNTSGQGWFLNGETGRLSFKAFDPDGDLRFLQVAWSTPTTSGSSAWHDMGTNRLQHSLESSIVFNEVGSWKVWVRAKDAQGHVRDPGPTGANILGEQKNISVDNAMPTNTGLNTHRPAQ